MGLTLITAPSVLPVSLDALKAWCGVEDNTWDTVLTAQLKAACSYIGRQLGRSLGVATWTLTLDAFSDAIELSQGPVAGIVTGGFTYVDAAGAVQVVDPALYSIDLTSTPQWIVRNWDQSWPEVLNGVNAVAVQFTAGWTAETLPDDLAAAVQMLAGAWYEDRGAAVPKAVEGLIWPHRQIRI